MNKISIITINFNNKHGLLKTIQSVITQTFQNIEYIIIDGGSTDGSIDIIKQNGSSIYYWVSEKDRGVYHAMNKGIEKSTGNYLLFLNSGDTFYNKVVLEEVTKYFYLHHEIIFGNINLIQNNKTEKIINYPDSLKFSFFFNSAICHQAIFYDKNVFQKVGYYLEDYTIIADWVHYITAIIKFECTYLHIPVTIANYPLNGISEQPYNSTTIMHERGTFLRNEFPFFMDDYIVHNTQNSDKRIMILKELENYPFFSKVATVSLFIISTFIKFIYKK